MANANIAHTSAFTTGCLQQMTNMNSILRKRIALAFSFLFLAVFSLPTKALDANDLAEFTVAGVQLGSTQEEAMQNMAKFFSIEPADIQILRSAKPMPITGVENWVESIRYTGGDFYADVRFTPSLAAKDSGYMVVYRIDANNTPHSMHEFEKNLEVNLKPTIDQLGPATSITKDNGQGKAWEKGLWIYDWRVKHRFGSEEYVKFGIPSLQLRGGSITFTGSKDRSIWSKQVKKWKADGAK